MKRPVIQTFHLWGAALAALLFLWTVFLAATVPFGDRDLSFSEVLSCYRHATWDGLGQACTEFAVWWLLPFWAATVITYHGLRNRTARVWIVVIGLTLPGVIFTRDLLGAFSFVFLPLSVIRYPFAMLTGALDGEDYAEGFPIFAGVGVLVMFWPAVEFVRWLFKLNMSPESEIQSSRNFVLAILVHLGIGFVLAGVFLFLAFFFFGTELD